jgi:hypothetical protein
MSDAKKDIDANDVWEAYLKQAGSRRSPQSAVAFAVEYVVAALRSPSPSVPEREAIARALCCPSGCIRPEDCWAGSKTQKKYIDAILALTHPDKRAGESSNRIDYECVNCIGMPEHGCYCMAMGAVKPGGPLPSTPAEHPDDKRAGEDT